MSIEISEEEGRSQLELNWEKNVKKHIFILSSAGKPIFSRYGDEQSMVTTFGLIQAVISIIKDSGDNMKCMRMGNRVIVCYVMKSLYFLR
jgi:hypothetical protein